MDAARKRMFWKTGALVLAAFACAAAFSAYLRPDMVAVFADLWAMCAALLR
ncbi:MAG: hypothetical protein AB1452_13195 [Pseudomonadota bacterium]